MTRQADVLLPATRRALEALRDGRALKGFYLAGGTGLALQLRHRVSEDLDFFTATRPLDSPDRERLIHACAEGPGFVVSDSHDGTLHGRLAGAHVSFLRYRYPLVRPLVRVDGVPVAGVEDIALMKFGAILGRGAKKDFLDLYAICQHMPLESLLRLGRKKFRDVEDFTIQVFRGLTYFVDAEPEPEPTMLLPTPWPAVKAFFDREVRRLAKAERLV